MGDHDPRAYDIKFRISKMNPTFNLMNSDVLQAQIDYLYQFLTEERKALFEEVLDFRTKHFTVVVEDIYKERNASAIARSCECMGLQEIHAIEKDNSYFFAKGIARGAEKWLTTKIHSGDKNNTKSCLSDLKNKGYKIVATVPDSDAILLNDFSVSEKAAFVFGGELHGLSGTAMEMADIKLSIPNYGFTESYNLSVAGAIVLYDIMTRLRKSDVDWQLSDDEKQALRFEWAKQSIPIHEMLLKRYEEDLLKVNSQ